jgi:hypothetical protein
LPNYWQKDFSPQDTDTILVACAMVASASFPWWRTNFRRLWIFLCLEKELKKKMGTMTPPN